MPGCSYVTTMRSFSYNLQSTSSLYSNVEMYNITWMRPQFVVRELIHINAVVHSTFLCCCGRCMIQHSCTASFTLYEQSPHCPTPTFHIHECACTDSPDPFSNNKKKGSEHKKTFQTSRRKSRWKLLSQSL